MSLFHNKNVLGYACGIGAAICWGIHAVIIRFLINEGIDPLLIGVLRLFMGAALLSCIVAINASVRGRPFPVVRYTRFFWLIVASLAANFVLFHIGLKYTIASDAILLEAFSPVMVLIISILFFSERVRHLTAHPGMTAMVLKIIIAGSIGSSLLLINDAENLITTQDRKLLGDIIEFIAMLAWALVMLGMHEYQKRESDQDSTAVTAQFLLGAGFLIAPFVPWSGLAEITHVQWIWITILGVFSTGFAYILWNIASKYLDVFPLLTLFNLAAIFTVLTESIVLGLVISWKIVVGGALILYSAVRAKIINAKYRILEAKETPGE